MSLTAPCTPSCARTMWAARTRNSMQCSSTAAQRTTPVNAVPNTDCFVNGTYFAHMTVRDYELDQFSVVNNGIYASYLQHARHRALAAAGMPVEALQQAGTLLALSELVMRYRAPLRAQDVFVVTAAMFKVTGARAVLQQTVLRLPQQQEHDGDAAVTPTEGAQVVLDAEATVVFLDTSYRPVRIPTAAKLTLQRLQAEYSAAGRVGQQ